MTSRKRRLRERVDVTQGHFLRIERGEVEIGAQVLLRIGREFGESLEWLLTGEREADKG